MSVVQCVCHLFRFVDGWDGCCWSCHHDADEGRNELSDYQVRGQTVCVCCDISNEFFPEGEHDDRDSKCTCRGCMAVVKPIIRESRVWWEAA